MDPEAISVWVAPAALVASVDQEKVVVMVQLELLEVVDAVDMDLAERWASVGDRHPVHYLAEWMEVALA